MSDNQNKDNSFSGINLKDAASIGIIGGVFQAPNNLLLKEKYHNWVEGCANIIRPCSHTIAETIDFFLQQCDAIPVKEDDHRIKGYGYPM